MISAKSRITACRCFILYLLFFLAKVCNFCRIRWLMPYLLDFLSFSDSTHYIAVVDGGLCFLHTGFEFSEAVRQREVDSLSALGWIAITIGVALSRITDVVVILTEQIVGVDPNGQSVVLQEQTRRDPRIRCYEWQTPLILSGVFFVLEAKNI